MGLFDTIFGSSKKEQEQPIRDKLKDRKHFERILRIRLAEIDRYKAYLTTEQESELFFCRVVGHDSIDVIQIRYSMDGGLKELQKIYLDSLDYFLRGFPQGIVGFRGSLFFLVLLPMHHVVWIVRIVF